MERKSGAEQHNRVYEEFEPSTAWARADKFDTLVVRLPGFKKEQLKVQVTSSNKLRISGERPLGNNRWSHFRKEFPISSNYDANEITAKFEDRTLYIKHPKLIIPADDQHPKAKAPTEAAPKPQKQESDYSSRAEKRGQEQGAIKDAPRTAESSYNGSQKSGEEADAPKTGIETQPSSNAGGGMAYTSADDDARSTASQKSSRQKTTDEIKSTSSATMEKDKNYDNAAMADKGAAGSSRHKFNGKDLKQALSGLATKMKQRRELTNLIVSVLLVLVALLYARYAIRHIGKSKN